LQSILAITQAVFIHWSLAHLTCISLLLWYTAHNTGLLNECMIKEYLFSSVHFFSLLGILVTFSYNSVFPLLNKLKKNPQGFLNNLMVLRAVARKSI
jgi:hypothetical protein